MKPTYTPKDESGSRNYNTRDTKRWCRGKVGVEYEGEWKWDERFNFYKGVRPTELREMKQGFWFGANRFNLQWKVWYQKFVCQNCGKLLSVKSRYFTDAPQEEIDKLEK
jgi:hypothetical protein